MKQTGSHGNEFMHSNRGIVENGVFCAVCAEII
jgi:hypothetical protein